MTPYRVKPGFEVQDEGQIYAAGAIVYLSPEKAIFHSASIEPVFLPSLQSREDLPSATILRAYRGQDVYQVWSFEKYSVEIAGVSGSGSIISTKTPHYLEQAESNRILIRIISPEIIYNLKTVATVLSESSFSIPDQVRLPAKVEIAEIAVPINLSGSVFTGGIYNYSTAIAGYVLNGTASVASGSAWVELSGLQKSELARLVIGARVRIPGTASNSVIDAVSNPVIERVTQTVSVRLLLDRPASSTLETSQIVIEMVEPDGDIGSINQSFAFDGAYPYGELIASLDKSGLSALSGSYPLQIFRSIGDKDELLLLGSIEVIA